MTKFQKTTITLLILIIILTLYPGYTRRAIGFLAEKSIRFISRAYGLYEKSYAEKIKESLTSAGEKALKKENPEEKSGFEDIESEVVETEVLSRVWENQEVVNFKKLVDKYGKSKVKAMIDKKPTDKEPYYTIRVFEDSPNHDLTFTFGWYRYYSAVKELYKWDPSKYYNWILLSP